MTICQSHTPRLYLYAGMGIVLAFFSLAVFGTYPFRIGYWNAEPITCAMFAITALAAFWLAAGVVARWLVFELPRRHLLFSLWLGWLVWQIICTAASLNPWRSWFGSPEQAEGLGWYVCASILMVQLAALWHCLRLRAILLIYTLVVMVALAAFHFFVDDHNNMFAGLIFDEIPARLNTPLLPFVWPDYLGMMAGWWWIALMLVFPALQLRLLIPASVLMFFILIASSNHAAMVPLGYAVLLTTAIRILHHYKSSQFQTPCLFWRRLALVVLILPLLWLVASPAIPTNYATAHSQSLPTRILLNHVTMTAIHDEPSRLLLGHGWGQFSDDFFKYALVRDVRIYEDGRHAPNWPLVRGYHYHSHNVAAEVLLSLGLIGLIIWLMMPMVAVAQLPYALFWQVVPMLVAITMLSYLWFAMPQTMPFQALCWFLLMRHTSTHSPKISFRPSLVSVGLVATGLLAVWSAIAQWQAMHYSLRMTDPFGYRGGTPLTAEYMQEDIKRGGDRLRVFFIRTSKRMVQARALAPKHIDLYRKYLASAEALATNPHIGAYNSAAILYGYNALITNGHDPLITPLRQHASGNYFEMARHHTRRAPEREDIIAPFLQAVYHSPQDTDHHSLMGIIGQLLEFNPAHRSALWLGGKILAEEPESHEQGVRMMRDALKMGADRIFPIENTEINGSD